MLIYSLSGYQTFYFLLVSTHSFDLLFEQQDSSASLLLQLQFLQCLCNYHVEAWQFTPTRIFYSAGLYTLTRIFYSAWLFTPMRIFFITWDYFSAILTWFLTTERHDCWHQLESSTVLGITFSQTCIHRISTSFI